MSGQYPDNVRIKYGHAQDNVRIKYGHAQDNVRINPARAKVIGKVSIQDSGIQARTGQDKADKSGQDRTSSRLQVAKLSGC